MISAPPVDEASPARRRPPDRHDAAVIFALALGLRLAVAAWARGRFPPAADGVYYERIAERIAAGFGYTWLWPDGVVTYAAHYPVGYPAALGALYAVFGASPFVAMSFNALIGALAAVSAHRLARRAGGRGQALAAGVLCALHPALLLYTPAIMTEGVTAALVVVAAALAGEARAHERPAARRGLLLAMAVVTGLATLVRPQSILFAPLFGLLAHRKGRWGRGLVSAALAGLVALLVCAPWTARNCMRMKRCALVSVNGGWNLLIGADEASTGAWAPIKVPEACREVYDEAEKDACFGREARQFIAERPFAWLALAPKKLAATFDYSGAPGYYLHASNPAAFDDRDKTALGVVETIFERAALIAALVVAARALPGERPTRARRYARLGLGALGVVASLTLHAFIGYLAFGLLGLRWAFAPQRAAFLLSAAAAVVLATAMTHAVFFGAGRYAMVVFPLLTALAPLAVARRPSDDPHRAATLL